MLLPSSTSDFIFLILYIYIFNVIVGDELHMDEDKNMTIDIDDIVNAVKDNIHKYPELSMEFCSSITLNVSVIPNSKFRSVEVSFVVADPMFKDCYEYYEIVLKKENEVICYALIKFKNDIEKVSHEFKNVSCGVYSISIHRYCKNLMCRNTTVNYRPAINMTSNDCLGPNVKSAITVVQPFENKIIAIAVVLLVLMIVAISGLIFCFYRSAKCNDGKVTVVDAEPTDVAVDIPSTRSIEVYILHYYDRNEVNRLKVEIIKDFYLQSGYFKTVRTIEDELNIILFDVNDWLNKMLKGRTEDGSIRKIILIASGEENLEDEWELENAIFSEFIDKLNDNIEQCLRGYDHLFVAQLISNVNYPEKLENIVRRVRYSLSEELIDDHLINLSLNLCSGSNLEESDFERKLRELLSEHPVKYLGSIL